jgi:hypothetical protein
LGVWGEGAEEFGHGEGVVTEVACGEALDDGWEEVEELATAIHPGGGFAVNGGDGGGVVSGGEAAFDEAGFGERIRVLALEVFEEDEVEQFVVGEGADFGFELDAEGGGGGAAAGASGEFVVAFFGGMRAGDGGGALAEFSDGGDEFGAVGWGGLAGVVLADVDEGGVEEEDGVGGGGNL